MKIFKNVLYRNRYKRVYVSDEGKPYSMFDEMQTEHRIPKIYRIKSHTNENTGESIISVIWRYVAEKVFKNGKWQKYNYYQATYKMIDYSLVTVGTILNFEFDFSKKLIA